MYFSKPKIKVLNYSEPIYLASGGIISGNSKIWIAGIDTGGSSAGRERVNLFISTPIPEGTYNPKSLQVSITINFTQAINSPTFSAWGWSTIGGINLSPDGKTLTMTITNDNSYTSFGENRSDSRFELNDGFTVYDSDSSDGYADIGSFSVIIYK